MNLDLIASRNNLPRVYGALGFVIINRNTAIYFDSFGIEYIPQKVLNKIKDKSNYSQ